MIFLIHGWACRSCINNWGVILISITISLIIIIVKQIIILLISIAIIIS